MEGHDGDIFENGVCRYEIVIEGETHNCAVGALLTREDLDRSMASFVGSPGMLFNEYGVPDYFLGLASDEFDDLYDQQQDIVDFLENLQSIHDSEENWPNGKFSVEKLDAWAADKNLAPVIPLKGDN